jgi:hypothetical protein
MARHFRERAAGALLATALVFLGASAEAGLNPEFTLYRTSNSTFFMDYDGDGFPDRIVGYGAPGDVGLLADVDGDTLLDLVVYRNGGWLIDLRNDGAWDLNLALGGPADVPVAADFLGLGKAGIGIYRPSNGTWYLDQDANGTVDHISTFGGAPGDQPVVADYDGDGRADRAIYNDGVWTVDFGLNTTVDGIHFLGGEPNDIALAGDFDGDWKADNAVFRDGVWFMDYGNDSTVNRVSNYGGAGDRPLFGPVNPAASRFVRAGAVGGNGTQALPYGTIAAALSGAPAGTIVRIAAGNYPENVAVFRRQALTFLGAGVNATHLNGGGAADAVNIFESPNIVLRNLHVQSPDQRGIVNQGSSMTLDRVATFRNFSHNVLGVRTGASAASFLIDSSNVNTSRMGNGLRLEGGVSATVRRSTIDRNGLHLTEPRPTTGNGRGVESFGDSQLTLEYSRVNGNYDGGLLIVGSSTAVVRYSEISRNGTNGFLFMDTAAADVYSNNILDNGVAGSRGAATGYNGIEVFDNWAGPWMAIHENWIFRSTASGMYIGGSSVNVPVANNYFYDNFLGLTANGATVTVTGNVFELPLAQGAEEGILIVGPGPVVTVGGPGAQNTFRNYLNVGGASPAIHCGGVPAPAVSCPAGGNVWDNVDLRVLDCPATCSPS